MANVKGSSLTLSVGLALGLCVSGCGQPGGHAFDQSSSVSGKADNLGSAQVESKGTLGRVPVGQETAPVAPERSNGKISDRFPNIQLCTHLGERVRFYDDLVKDRTVIINFMYANCSGICPGTTENLVQIHKLLGDRVGRDILMVSITLDPKHDTPEVLNNYAEAYGNQPGWLYLTGDYDEIDHLRHVLGVYDPDPVIDADRTQHSGMIVFGNDRTDRWAGLPGLMDARGIVVALHRLTRVPIVRGRHG